MPLRSLKVELFLDIIGQLTRIKVSRIALKVKGDTGAVKGTPYAFIEHIL